MVLPCWCWRPVHRAATSSRPSDTEREQPPSPQSSSSCGFLVLLATATASPQVVVDACPCSSLPCRTTPRSCRRAVVQGGQRLESIPGRDPHTWPFFLDSHVHRHLPPNPAKQSCLISNFFLCLSKFLIKWSLCVFQVMPWKTVEGNREEGHAVVLCAVADERAPSPPIEVRLQRHHRYARYLAFN